MASNPYVNKVQKADGTTIIDISDTTAGAADVASGKVLYGADGAPVTGTAPESVVGLYEGNPVVIPDGTAGDKLLHCEAAILPYQAGSGDPSPTNIRAISGYTGGNVYVSPTSSVQDATTYSFDWSDVATTYSGTVYGGTVDALGGKLYEEARIRSFDGTEGWTAQGSGASRYYRLRQTPDLTLYETQNDKTLCSHFTAHTVHLSGNTDIGYWVYNSSANGGYYFCIRPEVTGVTNLDTFKAWLAAQNTAGTPMQIVFWRQQPLAYDVTPVQISLGDGENHIWTTLGGPCKCVYYTEDGQDYRDVVSPEPVLVSKSITENGTYDPAADDADGYSSVTVAVPGGTYQAKSGITPTTSSQTITPDAGYDALSSVQINAIPSQYIVPSGNLPITANGTGIDVSSYATVSVAVNHKNVQFQSQSRRVNSTTYTDMGYEITVAKTGSYNIQWVGWRTNTSGTSGSQIYINDSAYGDANTDFDESHTSVQIGLLSGVSLNANDKVTIRARSRTSSYFMYIFLLGITEV